MKDGVIKTEPGGSVLYDFEVNVSCYEPTIVDVQPLDANLNEFTVFTAQGACLPGTTVAFIGDCDGLGYNYKNSTEIQFYCTPKWNAGPQEGQIKNQPGGTVLFEFTVDVDP